MPRSWFLRVGPQGPIDVYRSDPAGAVDATGRGLGYGRSATDLAGLLDLPSQALTGGGGGTYNQAVTHGEQLTLNDVGPWALQGVAKGSESLDTPASEGLAGGSPGWYSYDFSYWCPSQTYVYNNNPSNKGGTVPAGGMTIDGVTVPAGAHVAQFRDFSAGSFSNGQDNSGTIGTIVFRGCRFRNNSTGQSSVINDFNSSYTSRFLYCDMGSPTHNVADWQGSFYKAISGTGHIMKRTYFSNQYVTFQPNVPNCQMVECYAEDYCYFGGEAGPPGQEGDPLHMASVGCEGAGTGFRFMRNKIIPASPDPNSTVFANGFTMAFEGTGSDTPYSDCQVVDNYLSGFIYVFKMFDEDPGATSIVVTGNKITTKYAQYGGRTAAVAVGPYQVAYGSSGNVWSGNVWADDYGSGADGTATVPLSSRQYPSGNGPRAGTAITYP